MYRCSNETSPQLVQSHEAIKTGGDVSHMILGLARVSTLAETDKMQSMNLRGGGRRLREHAYI